MRKLAPLRWILLPCAVVGAALCVLSRPTPARAAFTVLCAWGWYELSSLLVYTVDRETLGIPLRGRV